MRVVANPAGQRYHIGFLGGEPVSTPLILAGDVGGTKTLLALFVLQDGRLYRRVEESYPSPDYPGLEAILEEFLRRHKADVCCACFGLPGPISEERVITPNLAWGEGVDVRRLRTVFRDTQIVLLNDLEATGYGLRLLSPEQFVVLNPGRKCEEANAALIAAGTGLGEAILFWDGQEHRPSASEGGHCDFAPHNPLEVELFTYVLERFGHVSFDRMVSGGGLHLIYLFLRDTRRGEEPAWLAEKLKQEDPAAVISEAALTQKLPLCEKALDIFVSLYGAEAGNLALKALARAGVYVGGGISPKIVPKLKEGGFVRAFFDKGRMSPMVKEIPVQVVREPKTALYGAVFYGARQAGWPVSGTTTLAESP